MKLHLRHAQTTINREIDQIAAAMRAIEMAMSDAACSDAERDQMIGVRQYLRVSRDAAQEAQRHVEDMLTTIRLREESEADGG